MKSWRVSARETEGLMAGEIVCINKSLD